MSDVAQEAQLSTATVSRFLNGSLSLPPETEARIRRAIVALNYRPNPHARRLSLGRSNIIALVVPEISNPFFAALAASVERTGSERGYRLMLYATENRLGRELDYLRHLGGADVDGILFATNHPDTTGELAAAIRASARVVMLDEGVDGVQAPCVLVDNHAAGRLAAEVFLAHGHRAFAYVGGPERLLSAQERGAGFRAGLAAAGLPDSALETHHGDYSYRYGAEAMRAILARGCAPTAILAGSDVILLGILEQCHEHGVRVPEDLSLITIDDVMPNRFMTPAISAVRQPTEDLGRVAVEILIAQIEAKEGAADPPPETRLPVAYIARNSVDRPRVGPVPGLRVSLKEATP